MENIPVKQKRSDWLLEKSQVVEQPFVSNKPILGGFITWFREIWNSMSTKWYVRPLLQQQNDFNRLLVEWLHDFDARLTAQDREQTAAIHDAAETAARVIQMNRLLQSIDQRLKRLEALQAGGDPPAEG